MPTRTVKVQPPRGLDLFYAMYAVGLVFGIEQISDSLYKNIKTLIDAKISPLDFALNAGIFLAILLLIVRFFWSTGNIKRAWLRVKRKHTALSFVTLLLHLPALLIQAVLVLFVCFAFTDRVNSGPDSIAVIVLFVLATAWNAAWLIVLGYQKFRAPESVWIVNNTVLVLAGACLLAALKADCVSTSNVVAAFIFLSIASSLIDLSLTAEAYLTDIGR